MAWTMLCLALCMLVGLGVSTGAEKHRPRIITFDAPGASKTPTDIGAGTWAFGINDRGVILGWVIKDENEVHHSYLRAPDGTFTIIDDPVADTGFCRGTNAWNLNEDGTVTGNYEDASDVFHGFLRTPHGSFTTIDVLGAGSTGAPPCFGQGTIIGGRNEAGTIAGYYQDASNVYHGYVRDRHGKTTPFDPLGSVGTFTNVSSSVINPEGAITGYYFDSNWVFHGFIRDPHGKIRTIDAPGAGADPGDGEGTFPMSINANGTIVGYFQDTNWLTHGFSRSPDGRFRTFDVPGAGTVVGSWQGTWPNDINPAGAITGFYADSNWVSHGFIRDPDGKITKFDVPGAAGTSPDTINSAGAITGTYWDASGVNHGFLRIP